MAPKRALPLFPPALCWRINHLNVHPLPGPARGAWRPAPAHRHRRRPDRLRAANDLPLADHHVTLLDLGLAAGRRPACRAISPADDAWKTLPINFVGHMAVSQVKALADGRKQITTASGEVFEGPHRPGGRPANPPAAWPDAGLAGDNGIAVQPGTLATSVPESTRWATAFPLTARSAATSNPLTAS
jgi:hypothetical protein